MASRHPAQLAGVWTPEEGGGGGDAVRRPGWQGQRQLVMPRRLEGRKLLDPSCMARTLLRPKDAKQSLFCDPV